MSAGRKPPGSEDIPDLAPKSAKPGGASSARAEPAAPSTRAPAKAKAASGAQDYFGSGTFGDDDVTFGGGELSLSLDSGDDGPSGESLEAPIGPSRPGASRPDDEDLDAFESTKTSAQSGATRAAVSDRRKWPTGRSPDPSMLRIDQVEVAVAAGHGPPPTSAVSAPVYAVRVLLRRRALAEKVKALHESFTEAERQRDDLIVAVAQEHRGKILLAEEGDRLFEPVVELERVALERRSALAGTNAEVDRRVAEAEAQIASLRTEATARQTATAERESALAESKRLLDRAEAKKKRLYIEVRAIVDLTEKSGGQMSPAQSAKVQQLEAEIARLKPELDAAAQATQAAQAAVTAAESDEEQVARRIRDAERARRALDQESQREIGTRSEGVSEAERQRAAALAEVGRAVLDGRGRVVDLPAQTLDAISRAEDVVERRATELEKFVRAMHAHDAPMFKTGLAILGAAVVAVVVLVGMLATGSGAPPPPPAP